MIKIVGLGTGTVDTLSIAAKEELTLAKRVVLQTKEAPVAEYIRGCGVNFETLDGIYNSSIDFDEFNNEAYKYILKEKDTVFGVMGSIIKNVVAEKIIKSVPVKLFPGVSFEDYAKDMSEAMVSCGVKSYSASDFENAKFSTDSVLIITEVDTKYKAADVVAKLLDFYPYDFEITYIYENEALKMRLIDINLKKDFNYSSTIVLNPVPLRDKPKYSTQDLITIMGILRGEGGCPWDKEQTHKTLRQYLLEESYEVIDAINNGDSFMLEDELGDVLLQVIFHSQIAFEHSEFDYLDVVSGICKKMINRHTHIFAQDKLDTAEEVTKNWERIKRLEKNINTYTEGLKDIPKGMSALMRAEKIQKKAANVGFDWKDYKGAFEKLKEEALELEEEIRNNGDIEGEGGDLLFAAVNVLRLVKVNSEAALLAACDKFIRRFEFMENNSDKNLSEMSVCEMDLLWNLAKKSGL